MNENHPMDRDVAAALGRIPSGLFIVTAHAAQSDTAMLASWVQQCSFEPPMVSLAIKQGRPMYDVLMAGAVFAVNVVPESNRKLVSHFGKAGGPGDAPFEGVSVERPLDGGVVLTDALAHMQCEVVSRADAGDHEIVMARVKSAKVHTEGERPAVHVRNTGSHY